MAIRAPDGANNNDVIIILMMTSGGGSGCVSVAFRANGPGLLSPTAFIWDYIV